MELPELLVHAGPSDMIPFVFSLTAGLCLLHCLLELFFLALPKLSQRAGFLAYTISAAVAISWLSIIGVARFMLPDPEDPLFGFDAAAQRIGEVMLAYQIYNLTVAIVYKEQRTAATLGHHTAAMASALAVANQYLHGYAAYCFGVFESSSIPLSVMDIFKMFPQLIERFPTTYTGVRLVFAIHFIIVRLVMLPPFLLRFFSHVKMVMVAPTGTYSKTDTIVMGCLFFSSLTLSGLQVIWGRTIVLGLLKAAGIIKSKPRPGKPNKHLQHSEVKGDEKKLNISTDRLSGDVMQSLRESAEQIEVADTHVDETDPMDSVPAPIIA